jgi:UDP-N-acetylmuramoyl-L-alanyl-D-glutamate--2,6-diaminopimelate ligase
MKLKDLIKGMDMTGCRGNMDTEIRGIAYNSKKVNPGYMFAAVKGTAMDGHSFIPEAIGQGASAILVSRPLRPPQGTAVIQVQDVRMAMGQIAARMSGNPSHKLHLVGITGTNGKTTITYILEAIIKAAGKKPGVIGTVNYRYPGVTKPAPTTTPESVDIHQMLAEMKTRGVTHVFMEVSSHALDQKRVAGARFEQALFTNLSQDHLDYHADMEDYFLAKKKLFTEVLTGKWELDREKHTTPGVSVINMDDYYGRILMKESPGRTIGYALENQHPNVRGKILRLDEKGLEIEIKTENEKFIIKSPVLGRHNATNLLAAVASAIEMRMDSQTIKKGVAALKSVPGRLEPIKNNKGILVLVDYAHSPDALKKALSASRELCQGRLILVFGCGGDRDRTKRPQMGEVAGRKADLVVVTSDNPRSEDPKGIIEEIMPGIEISGAGNISDLAKAEKGCLVLEDREKAIQMAVKAARRGDVVLIAGKGHEDYQIIGDRKIQLDDRELAEKALAGEPAAKRKRNTK